MYFIALLQLFYASPTIEVLMCDRYQLNAHALLVDMKRMQVDSATMALDVMSIRLTLDEYKRYKAEDAEKIKQMGVRLKSLQAVAKHELEVYAPINTELIDTVIVRDTLLVPVKRRLATVRNAK